MLALPGVASCSVSVTTGRASVYFLHGSGSVGSGGLANMSSSLEAGTGAKAGSSSCSSGARDVVRVVESLGFGAKV